MRPSDNLGLHHAALRIADVEAVRRFYVEILGFGVEREVAGEELWLTTGRDSLVFLRAEAALSPSPALDHLGMLVPERTDVARWEAYLRQQEVVIIEPTETFDDGSVGLMCVDPEGRHVQVLWHPNVAPRLARQP